MIWGVPVISTASENSTSIVILSPALYSPVDLAVDTPTTAGMEVSFVTVTVFSENEATGKSRKSRSFLFVASFAT